MDNITRSVSFNDTPQIKIANNDNGTTSETDNKNFSYKSISIYDNSSHYITRETIYQDQEKFKLSECCIAIKQNELQSKDFSKLDLENYINLLNNFFRMSSYESNSTIKEILRILKKSAFMMLKNDLLQMEETAEDITSKEFLFSYIEPMVCSNNYKHSLYTERLKDRCFQDIKKIYKKISAKSLRSSNDVHDFFRKINKHITQLAINQSERQFIKYIIAVMFESIMLEGKSKSTLLNIIATHIHNINNYFIATGKLTIITKIINELIHWTITYHTNSDYSSGYVMARRDNLSKIIDFLCTSLENFLYKSAFISSFIMANNKKIQKLSPLLTKTDTLSFNNTNCNYGRIWGGVTLLQKHSTKGNVYHVIDDTLPIFNKLIRKDTTLDNLEHTDDFDLVKTEDYNLCKKKIYHAIEHTNILFKREIYTEHKKYFSAVSFGLEGSVNSHIVNINSHYDFIHITEKLITAATMAMANLDDVVNPAIDAHALNQEPPEVYIISICLIEDNPKELELMDRYHKSLLNFNNKDITLDTAVFSVDGKKPKLMPYGVSMDLHTKIFNFNFKKTNSTNEIINSATVKYNNDIAIEGLLGKYEDDSFSSIKILKNIAKGNLYLDKISDDNSLLTTYCKKIIKKYNDINSNDQLDILTSTDFKLDDKLLSHINKIEYLIDSLLIMHNEDSYNMYHFSAVILLISSLLGGAQLFCCENGLSKINILDNHIKYLATEFFIKNNTNIDFKTCFKENITYQHIEAATQNQEEKYLLY